VHLGAYHSPLAIDMVMGPGTEPPLANAHHSLSRARAREAEPNTCGSSNARLRRADRTEAGPGGLLSGSPARSEVGVSRPCQPKLVASIGADHVEITVARAVRRVGDRASVRRPG
jgi:hypothetical protein